MAEFITLEDDKQHGSIELKIGFTGLELTEGKIKYRDETLLALQEKDSPKKVSPFFAEFIRDEFIKVEAIVLPAEAALDLLILDMEKLESRLESDPENRQLIEKCLAALESDIPLCDLDLEEDDLQIIESVQPYSLKPVILLNGGESTDNIIAGALAKSGHMFFYTSGPSESHAWLVKADSTIVSCAEKIHTDLARGFIKGDVVSLDDYLQCHNMNDCRSKGLLRLVDRDYIVQPDEVIEIRFNI